MPEKPPLPVCQSNATTDRWLPHVFTLVFTLLAFCHCHWAHDPLITSVLAYNLISGGTVCDNMRHPLNSYLGPPFGLTCFISVCLLSDCYVPLGM
jgi:hypothetical protein